LWDNFHSFLRTVIAVERYVVIAIIGNQPSCRAIAWQQQTHHQILHPYPANGRIAKQN
jgi:hypothetical protein